MLVDTLTLAGQTVLLFDLNIVSRERHQRHTILDKCLTDYFFEQGYFSYILHQPGKPAQLRLYPVHANLSDIQTKSVAVDYRLAISYALPLVAVSWSVHALAIDLAKVTDFQFDESERQTFCQSYLPDLAACPTVTNERLAQHWSSYEAALKCLGLPLQPMMQPLAIYWHQCNLILCLYATNSRLII